MASESGLHKRLTAAGLLITLGIIFGDIGTSPLYVMKAIVGENPITTDLVYGGISCIFWTLTIQTTFKYVVLTLRADNNGEGGIFSLYSLVKRQGKWLTWVAVIGGAALLADGMITPPISVISAVEGLRQIKPDIQTQTIMIITIVIISAIFFFQRFGTNAVGKSFGPLMFIWFTMLGLLGLNQILPNPQILMAINPWYALKMLAGNPGGAIAILGAVFLCTTGAEALYSDLGHCGRQNIRVSWIFVKICLLLNYFGQGAYLLKFEGSKIEFNPFYDIMPDWFLLAGITIATIATIIASQALISGSFTLVGEAIRLDLFPKLQVNYPTMFKGQLYIPFVNTFLWLGCVAIVLIFRASTSMEAAYGLAITVTMMMTSLLLMYYLRLRRNNYFVITLVMVLFFAVESMFLTANLFKFMHGGYVTAIIASLLVFVMWIRVRAGKVKRRLTEKVNIHSYVDQLISLSNDKSLPKYSTHLVFLSKIKNSEEVEASIIYSILQKQPKRADVYWFVHVDVTNEPYTQEYKVNVLAPQNVVKVNFKLGFRVAQRINLFLRKVVEDMITNHEIDVISRYSSLKERNIAGDFKFVILEEVLSYENDMPALDRFVMDTYIGMKHITATPERWFGLDTSIVSLEKVPLLIKPAEAVNLKRISDN